MRIAFILAAAVLALGAASCANRTGDQTIAEYCANSEHENHDICKQHRDLDTTRVTLSDRIAEVFGIANRADRTANEAMNRQVVCVTRTMNSVREGSCDPGYVLTSCTQTRYTTRAGGMAIMRSINDTECRYNAQVLEVQVRCCAMGPNPPPATMINDTPPPVEEAPPAPVS
jgi:hypothetical protein